eukprot:TRINITY_DN1407_c0_g1_i2.p1 TRINITY_DN1407_c0_g1~~TRINITY_DN1407_c0_g1_i2.p1  ORF type:complete len:169 (+),score=25.42 TRINITY_DN1407_c0_g1_i2:220-726(+)
MRDVGLKDLEMTPFIDRLFVLFDHNNDGFVDVQDFVSGMTILFKGSVEEKLELSFRAYDLDGDGAISKEELEQVFLWAWESGCKWLVGAYSLTDIREEDIHEFSRDVSRVFADSAFECLDQNEDGLLSFEEFREYANAKPKLTATLMGFRREVDMTFLAEEDFQKTGL